MTLKDALERYFPAILIGTGIVSLGLVAHYSEPTVGNDPRSVSAVVSVPVSSESASVVQNDFSYHAYSFDKAATERFVRGGGNDYELAMRESLGFFDDIPSHTWTLMKKRIGHLHSIPGFSQTDYRNKYPGFYYQYHNEPDFTCQHEMRIGNQGDGGKWVCDPHRITAQKSCLVYSVGSRGDFSFEEYVLKEIDPNCEIHTFDLEDFAAKAEPYGIHFHTWGFGLDTVEHNPKFLIKSLQRTVEELGHAGRVIDIFKIDCDNCEWETYDSWFEADVVLRQVQVEIHKNPQPKIQNFFRAFRNHGYVMFHKEPNIAHPLDSPVYAIELAFLKLGDSFFDDMSSLDLMEDTGQRTTTNSNN